MTLPPQKRVEEAMCRLSILLVGQLALLLCLLLTIEDLFLEKR